MRGNDSAIADYASLIRNDETTLVPQYLSVLVPSKRIAFTLAEVLITLGIIGVVAAMTMPTLIANHQQKVLNTKVKKTYSNIQNAFLELQNEYGTIGDNSVLFDASSNIEKLMQELSTHFNGAKFCKQRACPETNYTINYASNYYGKGGSILTMNFFNHRSILLPDGAIFSIAEFYPNCDVTRIETIYDKDGNETQKQKHITACGTLYFDVNGSKPPNTFGKDVFHLSIGRNKINHSIWPVTGGDVLTDIITGKN